ncbi:TIGR03986 family CRISPR-associated RAMP protein [Vreelandella aquamarina]
MTELSAPYRFVPLSRYILRPDWASHVSHDHPFADGVCGELDVKLTAHTRLCLGGQQQAPNDNAAGLVNFFRTPDNQLAIPGSSWKGMLRSVMEIACFGHFQQVEDQKLSLRDFTVAKNAYLPEMKNVSTGWLVFRDSKWQLIPCSMVRLHQSLILTFFSVAQHAWKSDEGKKVTHRYDLIGDLPEVSFDIQTYGKNNDEEAHNLGAGQYKGKVVVTGQPSGHFDAGRSAKKREFIFYNERPEAITTVSPEVMQGFLHIHADSKEWGYWKGKLSQKADDFPGIPVFYHQQAGKVISLGLSRMYKLPYKNSLHDAIGNTQPKHVTAEKPDLAGLIFGWLDEANADQNLRGRVMPGNLHVEGAPELRREGPVVLSSPKPTFYPAYIHQPKQTGDYKTLMDKDAELAGWKRYPSRNDVTLPDLEPKNQDNKNVQNYLETVPQGTGFTGKLRFHNLRLVELGALLWCLDFGQRPQCYHALGLGKPFGFGQVGLDIIEANVTHNNLANHTVASETLLHAARTAFEGYMDTAWQQATGDDDKYWEESPQVMSLLAMADPLSARGELLDNMPLADFPEVKKSGSRFQAYAGQDTKVAVTDEHAVPVVESTDLESLVEDAARRQAEKARIEAEKAALKQREQEKASMTPEQKQVADIEDRLNMEELNKTQIEKLAKDLLALSKMDYDWGPGDQALICKLGQKGLELGNTLGKSKLQKSAKKVVDRFCH